MPIHDFACLSCGHEFERLVLPKDGTTIPEQVRAIEDGPCPSCGKRRVGMVMSAFARFRAPAAPSCGTTGGS